MTQLKTMKLADGSDAICAELQASGGVIVADFLGPDLLSKINADMDPLLDVAINRTSVNPVVDMFFGDKVSHVSGLPGKSELFAEEVMCHPALLELCDRVLLPNCARFQGRCLRLSPRTTSQLSQSTFSTSAATREVAEWE